MIYLIFVLAAIAIGVLLYVFRNTAFVQKLFRLSRRATGQKVGYDKLEPIMGGMPKVLPRAWQTPKGAIVHSDTEPSAQALALIDRGLDSAISAGFKVNQNFNPPDVAMNWTKYRKHSEYRFLLMDTIERSTSPDSLDVPILLTYAGYVAGITIGFELVNWTITPVFPLTVMPKLTDTRDVALKVFETTVRNEAEHWITANDTVVFMYYTGGNDYHPIFNYDN